MILPVEFIEYPSIGPPDIITLIQEDLEEEISEDLMEADESDLAPAIGTNAQTERGEFGCDQEWMERIRHYIKNGKLPTVKWTAQKLRAQAARFVFLDGKLLKWRHSGPLMNCVEGEQARKIVHEVNSGSCGNHSGGKAFAIKIKRHGYFWPTMIKDYEKFLKKCEKC